MEKLKYSSLRFVSSNREKLNEYRVLLALESLKFAEVNLEEPQDVSLDKLVEEKINQVQPQLEDTPFFVEHTGLSIYSWNQLPGGLTGVFLERVGNEGICRMMNSYSESERTAVARISIGYHHPRAKKGIPFYGEIHGRIAGEPRGKNGFGWDPIFIPDGDVKTYGEMSVDEKNATSMRTIVSKKFKRYLEGKFEE